MDNLDKIRTQVKDLLLEFPETRDSDNLLVVKYFGCYYGWLNEETMLTSWVSLESIIRSRRKLQEDPKYWGNKKVRQYRKRLSSYFAFYYKYMA